VSDPLRFKAWLEKLSWTRAHEAAWEELERRADLNRQRTFEETYPRRERVEAWMEAAFVDNALACLGKRQRRLTAATANAIASQVISGRSWGWNNYRRPDQELSERDVVRYEGTLLLALAGAWDKVASALGSKPLARKVAPKKIYDGSAFGGLVRHCATAAKNKLGEGSCQPALKAWAARHQTSPGVLLALGALAIEGAGGHPCAEVATRLEVLLTSDSVAPVKTAAAIVEDAQASAFERYLPILNDKNEIESLKDDDLEYLPTSTMVHAYLCGLDEQVARKLEYPEQRNFVLPNAWLVAAASLGKPTKKWRELLRAELKRFHSPREVKTLSRYGWSTQVAAIALAAGDTKLVLKLTVGAKKEPFKPGKTFGEDARKAIRYFARAIDAKAKQADVTPAWLELLVAKLPNDHSHSYAGGAFGWSSLLCVAYAYFHLLGGEPEVKVASLLRDTLRGVAR
jgi:hypothetical protein